MARPKRLRRPIQTRSMDKGTFARMLGDRLLRAGEPNRPEYHAETFSLVGTAGKVADLGNIYDEYRQAPPQARQGLLSKWTRGWFRVEHCVPASLEDARSDLLPVIGGRGTHECDLLEEQAGGRRALPRQLLAADFTLGVAYDWPECQAYVNE
jgi:hypothetical protein